MINRYASLRQGLVGAWCPSLGASGYRLLDRSGNNNHGTLTNMDPGTDWVPSGGKLALDFDGVNDVIITDRNSPITTNRMSVSAWVYPLETGRADYVNLWNFQNVGQFQFNLLQGVTASKFQFFVSSGTLYSSGPSSATISTGRWYHLTGIFDGANVSLYVNGVFDSTGSALITLAQPTIPTVRIGNNYDGDGAFQGQIDDVRIYNRVLTPSEIRLLYTGGRGVGLLPEAKPKRARIVAWDNQDKISVPARVLTNTDSLKRGLVGHWSPSLSGPQGNRLMDLSGQNNHGTLQNMDYQTDYVPSAEKGGRMALDFDGSNDYVDVPAIASLPRNTSYTAASWFYLTAFGSAENRTIFAYRQNTTNTPILFYLSVLASTNTINFLVRSDDGAVASITTASTAQLNKWTHCCGVRRGNNTELFVNGISVGTASASLTAIGVNNITIGAANPGSVQQFFAGGIDDCRIYDRALTPSEIRLLAQSRMPETATPQRTRTVFYSSGLVSYLRRRTYNSILGSGVLS